MKNLDEFYNVSIKNKETSGLLKGFFNMKLDKTLNGKEAIDLGAGVGIDAKFLIDNGFRVTCIDKEEKSKEITFSKIQDKEKLKFIVESFEDVKLQKADLIYSCFSMQFCNPKKIDVVMKKIITNINKDGYFVR